MTMKKRIICSLLTPKYLLGLLILLSVSSCMPRANSLRNSNARIGPYDIAVIDNCEYIVIQRAGRRDVSGVFSITHKGDCSNPIHRVGTR
ncbi:hypothetical protein GCM10027275_31370 [Rhabdobacter roseus]